MTDRQELRRLLTHLEHAQRVAALGSWEAVFPPGNRQGDLAEGGELYWSPQAREIAGWAADRVATVDAFVELVHPDDRDAFLEMRTEAIAGRRPYAIDLRIVRPDGEVRHIHLAARIERDAAGGIHRFLGIVQDRTAQVRARQRLSELEAARGELLHQLLGAVERERAALAATLDEGAAAAVARIIADVERRRPTGSADGPAAEGFAAASRALHAAQESLRSLASSIEDVPDDGAGLHDVLSRLASATLPGLDVDVEVAAAAPAIPASLCRPVVRIAREAMQNVRKHAGASHVHIGVGVDDDAVELRVVDDGAGFAPEHVRQEPGHRGLTAMRQHAEAAGGTLTVTSQPGRTEVRATLPRAQGPSAQRS